MSVSMSLTTSLTSIFLLFAAYVSPAAADTWRVTGVASNDVLNIRATPSKRARIVAAIPPGGTGILNPEPCEDGWCPVVYNGHRGWVKGLYLTPEVIAEGDTEGGDSGGQSYYRVIGVASGDKLNMRSRPSRSASIVHALAPQATCLEQLGNCNGGWCRVRYVREGLGGWTGWVRDRYLTPDADSHEGVMCTELP